MAHTKTASNSERTTSITARSLTARKYRERVVPHVAKISGAPRPFRRRFFDCQWIGGIATGRKVGWPRERAYDARRSSGALQGAGTIDLT
jgi:hypothetical protein